MSTAYPALLLAFLATSAAAAPAHRFLGGSYDGHGESRLTTYTRTGTPPWYAPRFSGGGEDGYSRSGIITYAPAGTVPWHAPRFSGGGVDGYADAIVITYARTGTPPWHALRFSGGNRDGYAEAMQRTYNADVSSARWANRFKGGSFDGSALFAVAGLPSPLGGDTDSDGLPDWWEALYYGSLIATDRNGDTDDDGTSAGTEFAAGTDPTMAVSVFEVSGFTVEIPDTPGAIVQWSSVSNKWYRVSLSTNVMRGFSIIQTNIPATPPLNVHTDTTASGTGPWLYRVELE